MLLLDILPFWMVAVLIFCLRIVDVSLGTFRTISVVQGRTIVSVLLGFVEVGIWVLAVSQVVTGVREHPLLIVAFAGGFAAGNAAGITLERKLGLGTVALRIVSTLPQEALTRLLGDSVRSVAAFPGQGQDGPRTLLYASCPRRTLPQVLTRAQEADPGLFYVVERFSQIGLGPLPHYTGWRAVFKKK